jgi:hypothetical protein
LRLGKRKPNKSITSKQHELKGDVIKVISLRQYLGKIFPNIYCPRYKIVKLDSKLKSNVG